MTYFFTLKYFIAIQILLLVVVVVAKNQPLTHLKNTRQHNVLINILRGQNCKIFGGFYDKHRRIDTREPLSFVKSSVVVAVDEKVSGYRQVGNATGGGRGLITARLY